MFKEIVLIWSGKPMDFEYLSFMDIICIHIHPYIRHPYIFILYTYTHIYLYTHVSTYACLSCICVYICIHICVYIYVCIYICMYIYMYIYTYVYNCIIYIYICIHTYLYIYIYIHLHTCMHYTCMYIYIYCIYICIDIQTWYIKIHNIWATAKTPAIGNMQGMVSDIVQAWCERWDLPR